MQRGRKKLLASGSDVVHDGIEFGATLPLHLPLDRPPTGRCFTSRTMGHDLGVARSYPISVGRSMPHRPPAKIFLLFAGKTRTHRMWMCVHVRTCV